MSGCACGMNGPALLEVHGEPVVVFGLPAMFLRLEADGWTPEEPDFERTVRDLLRETKNRVPRELEAGCIAAIARIYREYLEASKESVEVESQGERQ
jgi:hypothetical protein